MTGCEAHTRRFLDSDLLQRPCRMFRDLYPAQPDDIPEPKVPDLIFWSAGKLGVELTSARPAGV